MRTAACACGQLSVRCEGEPTSVTLCHCRQCKRRTGSAYGVAAFFSRAALRISGDASTHTRASDLGPSVTFHFCPRCGSNVFWEPERKPDLVAVAIGAFADPGFPAPSKAVFTEFAHAWAHHTLPSTAK